MQVLGRREDGNGRNHESDRDSDDRRRPTDAIDGGGGSTAGGRDSPGAVAVLGQYRALDGSASGGVGVDVSRPRACVVVGKRGSGKSHTLGVLAAELARAPGAVPVVVDPVGALDVGEPVPARVRADALDPRAWVDLLGLDPAGGAGALVWRAAVERDTLAGMRAFVADADATAGRETRLAAENHLRLAATWGVFGGERDRWHPVAGSGGVRLDLAGVARTARTTVVRALADRLYRRGVGRAPGQNGIDGESGQNDTTGNPERWLLVDEADALGEAATPAIERLLARGRHADVGLVLATQRPGALPAAAFSQADLVIAHRLTGRADRGAITRARPTVADALETRPPMEPGEALVVDDATDHVHAVRVRERPPRPAVPAGEADTAGRREPRADSGRE